MPQPGPSFPASLICMWKRRMAASSQASKDFVLTACRGPSEPRVRSTIRYSPLEDIYTQPCCDWLSAIVSDRSNVDRGFGVIFLSDPASEQQSLHYVSANLLRNLLRLCRDVVAPHVGWRIDYPHDGAAGRSDSCRWGE